MWIAQVGQQIKVTTYNDSESYKWIKMQCESKKYFESWTSSVILPSKKLKCKRTCKININWFEVQKDLYTI